MIVICEDGSKLEYIEAKTKRLFNSWGYRYQMDIFKCLMDDSLFIPLVTYKTFQEGLEIDLNRFKFHESLFETNNIKTLFLLYEEGVVYSAWLHELKDEELLIREGEKIVVLKTSMKMKTFQVIDPDDEL